MGENYSLTNTSRIPNNDFVGLHSVCSLQEEDKNPRIHMVSGLMENRFDGA